MDKKPNYRKIYTDMIVAKFPNKMQLCIKILSKNDLTAMDVINIEQKIFGKKNLNDTFNQQHKSYDRKTILEILDYQKKNRINNSQLAKHFKLSRNTVTKWKKLFT